MAILQQYTGIFNIRSKSACVCCSNMLPSTVELLDMHILSPPQGLPLRHSS